MKLSLLHIIFLLLCMNSCGVKKHFAKNKEVTTVDSVDKSTLRQKVTTVKKGDSITHVPGDSIITGIEIKKDADTTTDVVESGGMKLTIQTHKTPSGNRRINVKAEAKPKDVKTDFTEIKTTDTDIKNDVRVQRETKTKQSTRKVKRSSLWGKIALIGGSLIAVLFLGWRFRNRLKSYFLKHV